MGEARKPKPSAKASTNARQLLNALTKTWGVALALIEDGDDDLSGSIGQFSLLYPDGTNRSVSDEHMRKAALAYIAAQRFALGEPAPKATRVDIPRAETLLAEMRSALRMKDDGVWPPPNFLELAMAHPPSGRNTKAAAP